MAYSGGSGTETSPYLLSTLADFNTLQATTSDYDKYFKLINGIDFASDDFTAIGDDSNPFTGQVDFQNYIIKNMAITTVAKYTGIFGNMERATLLNANLKSCTVNVADSGISDYITGILFAFAENCTITNCRVSGTITSLDTGAICGAFGRAQNCIISKCKFDGTVTATGIVTGGLFGQIDSNGSTSTTNECYSEAIVNVGGTPNSLPYVGGFVGSVSQSGTYVTITDCYSVSTVTTSCTNNEFGGVFVGRSTYGTYENCYSLGTVTGATYHGGFSGSSVTGETYTSCYYDSTVSGESDTGKGEPKTTAEMQTQSTFTDWDFTDTWYMDSYPELQYFVSSEFISLNSIFVVSNSDKVVLSDIVMTGLSLEYGLYTNNATCHIDDTTLANKTTDIFVNDSLIAITDTSSTSTNNYDANNSRLIADTDELTGTLDSTSTYEVI